MNLDKIANFIKEKRKNLGISQNELAEKLFVTEKAISRWETGRGTPDISLLIPLARELNVDVSEILTGEDNEKSKNEVEQLIEYNEFTKKNKFNFQFRLIIFLYMVSILLFLGYLRLEYDPNIELNYFIRLSLIIISSIFIIIGNKIYGNNYVEKLEDKKRIVKISQIIVFVYYIVLLFNMTIFARYQSVNSFNLIPFKTIVDIFKNGSLYAITINLFGNLFIFMPLEYFIIALFKINKFSVNLVLAIVIVSMIEILQFIFKVGVLDIDDVAICSLGMMLFYLFYNKLKKIFYKSFS